MGRQKPVSTLVAVAAAISLLAGAGAASAKTGDLAPHAFRPRIGFAMGILPKLGTLPEITSGTNWPVVYHGGDVMRNVTLHTIFWAPPGYHFDGSPSPGTLGYEALIKQFLSDVAHDSGAPDNVYSTLTQYHDASGPGSTNISYNPAVDSIDLTAPYPPQSEQCASPDGIATCITDLQLQTEIDQLIGPNDPGARGLSNIWYVFLPPDVDTCTQPGQCATTVFAGYHSEFDLGNGPTVYVPVPDPLVEFTPPPGSDPEGNPEAETTIDTVAHETEESITDPYGTAWIDPNGLEVADKCEDGPQEGTPLGYAPDGSPYNQVINGHEYLLQDMWSNAASGCVQSSSASGSPLPLHTVNLRQFSSYVSGATGVPGRLGVEISLLRDSTVVASAEARTRPNGSWGPVQLRSDSGAPHAVGDDREGIAVVYIGDNAPQPDLIATGDGGNPFTEAGYTGWSDLDHGYAVGSNNVILGPCGQTGVLALRVGSRYTTPPVQLCGTETDLSEVSTGALQPGTPLTLSSEDNRAESPLELNGALVKLTIPLGEPNSVSAVGNSQILLIPTGFPECTAYLRIESVRCTGLVAHARYKLGSRHARADSDGAMFVSGLRLHGGQQLALTNRAGRRLTTLHVAHLRVAVIGNQTRIASGVCQPGDFYGPPLSSSTPVSDQVGDGVFGDGTICPLSGKAKGLSTEDIAQTDDFSGGQTTITVPMIESTAPIQDETLYGAFVASAQSGLPGPHGSISATGAPIALTITRAASRRPVFHAANVDTATGVAVAALAPGPYVAKWVLRDANGDTRTVTTRFVDEG